MVADIRKVALLISCLPRRLAVRLIERLPSEYGDSLYDCLDGLTDIDRAERQRVVREFLGSCKSTGRRRYRVDVGQSQPPSFHFLTPLPATKIAELLRAEMPQAQAVILSRLPSTVTDEVLSLMPEDQRSQVAQRLKCLPPISGAALQDIAEVYGQILDRQKAV